MHGYGANFWKKAPFSRILLALAGGIILHWYLQLSLQTWGIIFLISFTALLLFFFIPFFSRYRFAFINGTITTFLFVSIGALLAWQKDIRNDQQWLGNFYIPKDALVVTLDEPPVEKTRSLKTNATVNYLLRDGRSIPVKGKIILYFKKDTSLVLSYGSRLIIKKSLQEIKNAGNPGGFDYKRYSLFGGITHQVYLTPRDFDLQEGKKENWSRKFIYTCREKILHILRSNIKSEKELGLAEALLIGYKNDLDQSLVQSYTNTGVVHIIAISGLHLGLIYWLLALLLKPLRRYKKVSWLRPVLIITGLWLFSLLAGAQPSILRSALMFTCIVLGEFLSRKTSIYNSMAVSAFILLCINPYWLWDVGFQLSYAAVLSIIIFMQPVYNWFYIKNKLLDFLWKLNAVTLAAQILTIPLSIYHFHQFPNLFLLTNLLAVPLSSFILLGEIFLCLISFVPAVAIMMGKLITALIRLMNSWIESIETIPFSSWDSLQITSTQAILLLTFIAASSYWLMEKSIRGLKWGLMALLGFIVIRSGSFLQINQQQKIIVYNVSQKKAIDIINGRSSYFLGDSNLLADDFARNFHLTPSRTLHRIRETVSPGGLYVQENFLDYRGKHILLLDQAVSYAPQSSRIAIDLLVISKNPKLYMNKLVTGLDIKQVVFDGSVPDWKSNYWKKDCDSLKIPWHDVKTNGAFVMNLR